jgi:hypothetical protein
MFTSTLNGRTNGSVCGITLTEQNRSILRKITPVSLCPPQILKNLARARTWAEVVQRCVYEDWLRTS